MFPASLGTTWIRKPPRPEKLVVDFDTTVNSSPTDISGQGNHGTFVNGASYSAADKAFTFPGNPVDGNAGGTHDSIFAQDVFNGVAPVQFSASLWINPNSMAAWEQIFVLGKTGDNLHDGLWISGTTTLSMHSEAGSPVQNWYYTIGDKSGEWIHLTVVRRSSTYSDHTLYLNGEPLTVGSNTGGTVALALPAVSDLRIGGNSANDNYWFDGKLSNFKLYNTALEASEVRKLYNLGRTGRSMVISDTAVGIGKVPEAQLDVRGSGGFTGDLTVGGNMNNYQYWFRGNRNGQNTNGATTGSLLVIQYESIAGSYTSAWTGSNAYNCPVAGVYMVHGGLMCFSNAGEAGFMYVEVRRYNSAGAQLDLGSANDMHTPYRDNTYQSYHFQQTHLCNKGDRLQIMLRGSNTDAHLDLHSGWGPLSIYKIG